MKHWLLCGNTCGHFSGQGRMIFSASPRKSFSSRVLLSHIRWEGRLFLMTSKSLRGETPALVKGGYHVELTVGHYGL